MNTHQFNDMEGLRIAAEMEKRGLEFYTRAAKVSKSKKTVELLKHLAEDERRHFLEFDKIYRHELEKYPDDTHPEYYSPEASAYLSAIAADVVFSGGLMALGRAEGFDSAQGILKYGIESEKDSILFYSGMMAQTQDEGMRLVFREIIFQEMGHLAELKVMLDELK